MSILSSYWFGFADTPQESARIVGETGVFYLSLAGGYLCSFFYMRTYAPTILKQQKMHLISILLWAFTGGVLIFFQGIFSLILTILLILLSLIVLYQLQFTSPLMAQADYNIPTDLNDKKSMYGKTLLTRMNYNLGDALGISIINEQILWILILYRSCVTLRASFGL